MLCPKIAHGWSGGLCKAEIARQIGRHPSTIGRELARNQTVRRPPLPPRPHGQPHPRGPRPGTHRGQDRPQHERLRYCAALAQAKAEARARRPQSTKLGTHPALAARPSPESVETSNWWILVLMPRSAGRVRRRLEGGGRSRGQGWP